LTDDLAFLVLGGGRLSAGLRLERAYWKKNHDSSKQYKANRRVFFSTKSMFNVSSPLFADVSDYILTAKSTSSTANRDVFVHVTVRPTWRLSSIQDSYNLTEKTFLLRSGMLA
jgi:hypothetical protein